jgi:cobalt-zinc-cadmium efflux system outer membrane protein
VKYLKTILLFILLSALPFRVIGQSKGLMPPGTAPDTTYQGSEESTVLSVQKALQVALDNNPKLHQREQELRWTKGQQKLSLGIENPELYYMKEGIDNGSYSEQRWAVSQSLNFPLQSAQRYKQYDQQYASAEASVEAVKLQIKADVKKAYTDLSYAIERYHLTREQVNLAEQLLNTARTRLEVGETTKFDVLQAEIQLAEANNDRADSQQMIQRARYELFNVIGLEPEQQVYDITFPDTLRYVHYDIQQEEVLAQIDTHPLLSTETKQLEAQQWNLKAAKSSWLPDIRVDYYRQELPATTSDGFSFQGFELGFKVPLWFFTNQQGTVQKAQADLKRQEWRRTEIALEVKKRAEQAWHSYQTSKQTIDRYRSTIQSQSKELLDLTLEGYRAGEMDLLSLLQAQRTYLDSQRRYLSALRDYYMQLIALEQLLQKNLVFNTNQ